MICIFCKKPSDNAPPEHFIPEHIGGRDTIECVCKSCNHGFLAKIDGRIRNNLQLSMAIDSTSRPRYAELLHPGDTIKRKVRIIDGKTNKLKYSASGTDGPIQPTSIKITIKSDEDHLLYKVFAKIFFESLAFKFGCEEALLPQYDVFRTYLSSKSDEIPTGLSIKLVSAHVSGNKITELISFDQASNRVVSKTYEISCKEDLTGANIILAENADTSCNALIILLGGKKSGRIIFQAHIPKRFVYFMK